MRFILLPFLFACLLVVSRSAPVYYLPYGISIRDLDNSPLSQFWARTNEQVHIEIAGKSYTLEKNDKQGNAGHVYKVVSGTNEPAYAKEPVQDKEAATLHTVGQLILSGTDSEGKKWAIMKAVPGKVIKETKAYSEVKAEKEKCKAFVNEAATLAAKKAWSIYQQHGVLHQDVSPGGNALFSDDAKQVNLVDWGLTYSSTSQLPTEAQYTKLVVGKFKMLVPC